MSASLPSAGRRLRLVSRAVVHAVLRDVLSECLGTRGFSALELLRAQRAAVCLLSQRLQARSRRVRGLTRAEFLAELERSRAGFAGEKRATERALAELVGATPAAGAGSGAAQPGQVELLERRVAKMRRALAELEARYQDLAARAGEDHGLPSLHRQALACTPEQHRAALTRIFELNVRLQRRSAG